MEFQVIVTVFSALVGFPALLAVLINSAKKFGWLPDGYAPTATLVGNLIAFVAVGLAVLFGKIELVGQIDEQLGALSKILLVIIAFVTDIGLTRMFNEGLRGIPLIGFSHSAKYDDIPF